MATLLLVPPADPLTVGDLLREEQARALGSVNSLRFLGTTAFFGLFLLLGAVLHEPAWHTNLPLFAAYWVFAGAVLWLGRRRFEWRHALGLAVAALDMPAVFFLQLSTFPHSNPSGVAGFTIGFYVLLIFLSALTLESWALVATTVVGMVLEATLQRRAGVDPGAIGAGAILLSLSAIGFGYARREIVGLVARVSLISDENRSLTAFAQELRAQALVDLLTGLYNRRGFFTLADKQLASARRTQLAYVLVFMDLDGLKTVNDTLGHGTGDEVRKAAADVIRRTFRESDVVGRLGGDEFVALTALTGGPKGSARILERLEAEMAAFNRTRS